MVFELKAPDNKRHGVLIFTHKEFKLLFNKNLQDKNLKKLKRYFFVGVHWGASEDKTVDIDLVDFHFAYPEFFPENKMPSSKLVNLTTRNFLSEDFINTNSKKTYDIITVGRKVKVKRYLEFFLIIKKVMVEKPDLKVLIISPSDENPKKSTLDHLFDENFNKLFTESEKNNITIYSENKFLGRSEIINLLNKSRVFLFTSIREGGAKVTAEAALCGLKILIFKNFRGGATYGIDQKQYSLYENIEDGAKKIIKILNNPSLETYTNFELYENESIAILESFLSNLYKSNNMKFDGNFNKKELVNNLNSFNNSLPKNLVVGNSNDLKNNIAFLKYCRMKNIDVKYIDYAISFFLDINLKLRELVRKWKNLLPLFVWKIYRRKNQYKKLFK